MRNTHLWYTSPIMTNFHSGKIAAVAGVGALVAFLLFAPVPSRAESPRVEQLRAQVDKLLREVAGLRQEITRVIQDEARSAPPIGSNPTYTPPPTPKPLVCGALGDVNGDGVISSVDADMVKGAVGLAGGTPLALTPAQISRANVNGDRSVTAEDFLAIQNYLSGKASTFSGCPAAPATIPVPVLTALSSYSGPTGTAITIFGRNFSTTDENRVTFTSTAALESDTSLMTVRARSANGTTLTLTVPTFLSRGNYAVRVDNGNLDLSNTMPFTVTVRASAVTSGQSVGSNPTYTPPPTPKPVMARPTVTLTVNGSDVSPQTVQEGSYLDVGYSSTGASACAVSGFYVSGVPTSYAAQVGPVSKTDGYTVSVTCADSAGKIAAKSIVIRAAEVTLSITSLTTSAAPAGAQVVLKGTGFSVSTDPTPARNVIYFRTGAGAGTAFAARSTDGYTLVFAVPNFTPGIYQVWVENEDLRESNKVPFTLTSEGTIVTIPASVPAQEPKPATAVPAGPAVTLTANGLVGDIAVPRGTPVAFSWASTNATGCVPNFPNVAGGATGGRYTIEVNQSGTYAVTCYDANGRQAANAVVVTVTAPQTVVTPPVTQTAANQLPEVKNPGGPSSLFVGVGGTWTVAARDPDGTALTYMADWGDGTPVSYKDGTATAVGGFSSVQFTHSYAPRREATSYTITFTVRDASGAIASVSKTVAVQVASQGATAPLSLKFTADGSEGNIYVPLGKLVPLAWNAAGAASCRPSWNPEIIATSGAKSVSAIALQTYTVTCVSAANPSASISRSIDVNVLEMQVAAPASGDPLITTFEGPSTLEANAVGTWRVGGYDPDGTKVSYLLLWGDSSGSGVSSERDASASYPFSESHSKQYPAGTYTVTLTLTDGSGKIARREMKVVVGGGGAQGSAIISPTVPPAGAGSSQISVSSAVEHRVLLKADNVVSAITIPAGTSATLSWDNLNVIPGTCSFGGGVMFPANNTGISGTVSTGVLEASKVFRLACIPQGGGAAMSSSVTVHTTGVPPSAAPRTIRVTNPGSYYASGQTATILFETTGNISRVKWELCEGANGTAPCRLMSGDVAVTGRAAYIYWWPQAGDWYVGKALWVKVSDVSSQATGSAGPFYILRQ